MKQRYKKIVVLLLITLMLLPQNLGAIVAQAATDSEIPDIPVLLMHRIVDNPSNEWTDTSTKVFKQFVEYLDENNYNTLTSEQYVNIMEGTEQAPDNPILLTFDDGTVDFINNALPILEQYDMKSVLFIVADWIGNSGNISEEQLKDLANNPNVSLENHTKNHDGNIWGTDGSQRSEISKEDAEDQIIVANEFLKGITGKDPVLMAYPYGRYNENVIEVLMENGIKYGFKAGSGDEDAYRMGRHYITDQSLTEIARMIGGPTPEVEEENQTETSTVYHETFADGQGLATSSGGAGLEVMDKEFSGNENGKALSVSNRKNDYDAVDFAFSDIGFENGKNYTVTVTGYVDSDTEIPAESQVVLSTVDSYTWHSTVNFVAGETFTLTKEITVDTDKDEKLRVQSNEAGATVSFYIGEIIVTETKEVTDQTVYIEDFENGKGLVDASGGAVLESVDKEFPGNKNGKALSVSNRKNDYDAADLVFSDIGLENGETYTVIVTVYVDSDSDIPAGSQVVLSTVDSYTWHSTVNFVAGETFTLTKDITIDTDEDEKLRIQSNEAGASVSFYIGDILITKKVPSEGGEKPKEDFVPFNIAEFSFEEPEHGFASRGDATALRTNEASYEGDYSLKVTGRTADWHGTSVVLDEHIYNGATYNISGYVKAITEIEEPTLFKATIDNIYYQWGPVNLENNEWTKFEGTWTNHDNLEAIPVYFESENVELDFYLDNIVVEIVDPGSDEEIVRPPAKEFTFIDFENAELNGFGARGDNETVVITDEENHTKNGTYSVKVAGRESNWNGPSLEVTDYINVGEEYQVSVWAKVAEGSSATLQLSTQVGEGSGAAYNNITSQAVTHDDDWVLLEGTYRYASLGGGYVTIYVEANNLTDFYIDDVNFVELESDPIEVDLNLNPIKEVYQDDFLIGNAVSIPDFEGLRLDLLNHHHNVVTAENAMKPGDLYNGREFDFTGADRLVERIIEEELLLHAHVLVWHQQSPEWLWESKEDTLANMQNHIKTVMEHFEETAGESLISWDVVNEALDGSWENPEDWKSNLRNTGWRQALGDDYIYEAFKYARQIADDMGREDLILYYNDYNDHLQPKAETMYYMIKDINERYAEENPEDNRALISGVGMQGHYTINLNPALVKQTIERFEKLGIEISITELDVTTITEGEYNEKEINRQGYIYASLFKIFKEHADSISRVTLWGLNDSSSWRSDRYPLLFNDTLGAKPAYFGAVDPDDFLENYVEEEIAKNHAYAVYGTPEIDADIDEIWAEAPVLNINRYQGAWESGATGTGRVLWDEEYLYVLYDVNDPVLDATGSQAHEQDSVEAFINETGEYSITYQDGVGQYRVNYLNEASFNPGRYSDGFESATRETGKGYVVEMAIPWKEVSPESGHTLGFDLQINDATNGARDVATAWNDLTGQGFQDPSVFGEVTLVGSTEEVPENEIVIPEGVETNVEAEQKVIVKSGDKEVSVKAPVDLPVGTEIKVNFVDPTTIVDPKSESGVELEIAGEIVTVDLTFPEGYEGFEGEFELTLTYNKDDYQWVSAFYYNEDEGVWERRTGGIIDRDKGEIRLTVSGFSTYGVFEVGAEEVIEDLEEVIRNLTDRVNELDENATGLEELIEALRGEIEDLRASEQSLSDILEELLAKLQELEDRIAKLEGGGNETPGTGDGEADEDSGPVLVDPDETDDESDDSTEKPAEKDKDGNALPATATSLFNYMLIGALVLLVGAGLALYSYKRKRA
ncbi:MAG TPA: polysaccharide deacetylase family protein [Bacilli bacterium]|nr:polysaccharide deacetylase family protein [Bacilli bacterium]